MAIKQRTDKVVSHKEIEKRFLELREIGAYLDKIHIDCSTPKITRLDGMDYSISRSIDSLTSIYASELAKLLMMNSPKTNAFKKELREDRPKEQQRSFFDEYTLGHLKRLEFESKLRGNSRHSEE